MKIEVVAVGSELLNGDLADKHTARFGRLLRSMGLGLHWGQTIPDDLEALTSALRLAGTRADLVLVTGGLGSTDDDLTMEAASAMSGAALSAGAAAGKGSAGSRPKRRRDEGAGAGASGGGGGGAAAASLSCRGGANHAGITRCERSVVVEPPVRRLGCASAASSRVFSASISCKDASSSRAVSNA